MAPSKAQRWLDILAVLIGHHYPVPVDRLMEQVPAYRERWVGGDDRARSSVRRMFERDKDELRKLGIPLRTEARVEDGESRDGYCISRRDFYLPYLRLLGEEGPGTTGPFGAVELSEAEARVAIRALREVIGIPTFPFHAEARTALRKLTFDLDPALSTAGDAGTVRVLDRPGGADPEGVLGTLIDGLYDRQRVTFRYHSIGRDAIEERDVEPWGLLYQWGSWYLVGRDVEAEAEIEAGRESLRLFRLDRMSNASGLRPDATRPEFEIPDSFDLARFADREAWELGSDEEERTEVRVRFHPPASRLAARNEWGELVEEPGDGSAIRSFRVSRLDPLLRWVLSQAGEAEVIAPPAAADRLREMARGILAQYGGERA